METSEVALVSFSPPATDFNFGSGCSTPYISVPSSPARIPDFFRSDSQLVHQFYRKIPLFEDAELSPQSLDQRSGVSAEQADFAFDFGRRSDGYESVFAEELFDGGKIKPLKTELKVKPVKTGVNSIRSPKVSPKHRSSSSPLCEYSRSSGDDVGSLAPEMAKSRAVSLVNETVSFWDIFPFFKQYRKWKLKSLLFRSASEGRNDVVGRSSSLQSNESNAADTRNDAVSVSSFRSNEGRRRRARSVSAHELHYTLNRAASQELKRRTFLPYKQGLLGCLGFGNSSDVFSSVGSMTRG